MVRLVVSMTTIPSRMNSQLFFNVLKALNKQSRLPDTVYLSIPKVSSKGIIYPELDPQMKDLCKVVFLDSDYGPVCKILGALLQERDDGTLIVTCDDDAIFSPDMLERIELAANKYSNAAIGGIGIRVGSFPSYISVITNQSFPAWKWWMTNSESSSPKQVDILCGFSAVAYRRKFLDVDEITKYALADKDIFTNDDILLSGLLSKAEILRLVVALPLVKIGAAPEALSAENNSGIGMKCINAYQKCKKEGMFPSLVNLSISDQVRTASYLPILLVLFVVLVVLIRLIAQ